MTRLQSLYPGILVLPLSVSLALAQHTHPSPPKSHAPAAPAAPAMPAADSAAIIATVERFHALLEAGDTLAVARMLAPDMTVLESGSLESRADYLSHHLHADAAFAKAVKGVRRITMVASRGDVAWTIALSTNKGTFRARSVNSRGVELMVLTRSESGWLINAIHWSSARGDG